MTASGEELVREHLNTVKFLLMLLQGKIPFLFCHFYESVKLSNTNPLRNTIRKFLNDFSNSIFKTLELNTA